MGIVFQPSFRGAVADREPGIQKRAQCLHLDSGSAPFGASRNDEALRRLADVQQGPGVMGCTPYSLSTSCPDLFRASTPCGRAWEKDVDGRHKPGHDE